MCTNILYELKYSKSTELEFTNECFYCLCTRNICVVSSPLALRLLKENLIVQIQYFFKKHTLFQWKSRWIYVNSSGQKNLELNDFIKTSLAPRINLLWSFENQQNKKFLLTLNDNHIKQILDQNLKTNVIDYQFCLNRLSKCFLLQNGFSILE